MYLNPALTGCFISPVVSVSERIQWPKLTGTFKTVTASYHQLVRILHGGLGFYFMYDNAGEMTMETSRLNLSYAAHFEINDQFKLRVGVTGGYVKRTIDWDKLTFGDLIDPRYGFIYPITTERPPSSKAFYDCGIGIVAYTKKIYFGFAADHLNQPDESFIRPAPGSRLPMKLIVNAGADFQIGSTDGRISISPDLIFLQQKSFTQTIASVTGKFYYLLIGTGLRIDNGFILSVGLENRWIRLCGSYDQSNSSLANKVGASYELSVAFKLYTFLPAKGNWTPIGMKSF